MEFTYYYDFEDCFQLDLSGNPITYVVGSTDVLSEGAPYIIFPIEEPNSRVCATYMTASTSTAATHYTDVNYKYDSCDLCLEANGQVITVTGLTKPNLSSLNLIADKRFKKGDVIHVDVIYDDSGTLMYINSPAIIINTQTYVSTGSTIPSFISYVPYNNFQQVIESKGVYYLVEDCSGGTQSVVLSKDDLLYQNSIISLPYGVSPCKIVLTALTDGEYSVVSGQTTILSSTLKFSSCEQCLSSFESAAVDDYFEQNTYSANTVNDLKPLNDGTILIGGTELQTVDDGNLYNFGNILKLNQDGSLNLSFNPNTEGSLSLDGDTFIYSDYNENFNLSENFSVEFWFKLGNHGTDGGIISFKDSGADNGWQIRFEGDDNYLTFEHNSSTLTTNTELSVSEWYHIAVVNDCGTDSLTMYINGTSDVTTGCTSGLTASTETTFKVGVNRTLDSYVTGLITNVRIVNGGDNFAYDGNFTPQTTPLRNRQNGYDTIRTVEPGEVALLLNFVDKYNILLDSSTYKIPFYINKPDVARDNSAAKCVCVSYLNTGPATVFNYYKCFEPGTITTGNLLQSVSLGAGQTSTSVCMQASSVNMNQNPNLIPVYNQYGSSQCVLIGFNQYLCPGPCNCNSVKNNTADPIELRYYDCNRDYITGTFISPGAPEILVCSLYFEPSDLTIVNQGYQCTTTTANYPYGWQCLPPIDPRCKPLVLFSGAPSNIVGSTITPVIGRFNFTSSSPGNYTQINLTAGGAYPPVNTTGNNVFLNMCLTHIYDFSTDEGKLWIKFNTGTTNTTTLIYEFDILNSNFDCDYQRTITIQLGGTNTNNIIGPGMTAVDENTLILSRGYSISNASINYQLVRVNITSNNPNPSTDITLFVSLPLINNVNVGNNLGNLNPFSSIRMVEGDRVIVACKQGPQQQGSWAKYLLQYTYPGGVLEAVVPNITPNADGGARGAYSYNDSVIEWKRPGNTISNSSFAGRGINLNSPYGLYAYPPYNWPTGNIQNMPNTAMALDISSPYPNILAVSTCGLTRLND